MRGGFEAAPRAPRPTEAVRGWRNGGQEVAPPKAIPDEVSLVPYSVNGYVPPAAYFLPRRRKYAKTPHRERGFRFPLSLCTLSLKTTKGGACGPSSGLHPGAPLAVSAAAPYAAKKRRPYRGAVFLSKGYKKISSGFRCFSVLGVEISKRIRKIKQEYSTKTVLCGAKLPILFTFLSSLFTGKSRGG